MIFRPLVARLLPKGGTAMIPDSEDSPSAPATEKDDAMLAGYRECATEALNWLLGLGYEPGHPLIRSLAAHLTKKQAYLEKINLERFLIDETLKKEDVCRNAWEVDSETLDSKYKTCVFQIRNNKEIQRKLVDAVYKGCDLRYSRSLP